MEFIKNNIKIEPKINKKKINNETNEFYSIYIKGNKNVELEINNVLLPFGLEEEYNNFIIKINLDNNNSQTKELKETVTLLEKYIEDTIQKLNNNKDFRLVSKIKKTEERFDDLLVCKIPQKNNKVKCYITDYGGYFKTIYDLGKKTRCNIVIYLDILFLKNNKIYYTWKIKEITIIT